MIRSVVFNDERKGDDFTTEHSGKARGVVADAKEYWMDL